MSTSARLSQVCVTSLLLSIGLFFLSTDRCSAQQIKKTVAAESPSIAKARAGIERGLAKAGESLASRTPADAKPWLDFARSWLARAEQTDPGAIASDDPDRDRVKLATAIFEAVTDVSAKSAEKLERAIREVEQSLARGDVWRVRAKLRLGDAFQLLKDAKRALDVYREAAEESRLHRERNPRERIQALSVIIALNLNEDPEESEVALAEMLDECTELLPADDPTACDAWRLFSVHVESIFVRSGAEGDGGSRESRLRARLERVEKTLVSRNIDPSIASLCALWSARLQWSTLKIAETEATLSRTSKAIDHPKAPPALVAMYWNLRGLVAAFRAEYADARTFHDKALDIRYRLKDPLQAESWNNLGELLLRQGDYRDALEPLEIAVDYYASTPGLQNHPARSFALTNLGKALEGENRFGQAEQRHVEALKLAEASNPVDPAIVCLCRNNLGINKYLSGSFAEARREFERAFAVAKSLPAFRGAEVLVNLGWSDVSDGKPDSAAERFRSAAETIRRDLGDTHPRTAEILAYIARVDADRGKIDDARAEIIEALTLREQGLDRILRTSLSGRDRLAYVQELRVHPESIAWPGVLDVFLELAPALGIPVEEQYRRLLPWKGAVERHAPPKARELESDPVVRKLAEERDSLLKSLRTLSFIRPEPARRRSHQELIRETEERLDGLDRRLQSMSPRFRSRSDASPATPERVSNSLPEGAALLDLINIRRYQPRAEGRAVRDDHRYIGFLTKSDRSIIRVDFGDAAPIDGAARALLDSFDPTRLRDRQGPAAELAKLVRDKLPSLRGVSTLIVSGDALLHHIPWGCLPNSSGTGYWIEDLAFAHVPTADSLVSRRERSPTGKGALFVGGVDYGSAPSARFKPLGETLAEAEAALRLYERRFPNELESVVLLSGEKASGSKVRELVETRRFVHFATHGTFDRFRKGASDVFNVLGASARLDSRLAFAGANDESKVDSILTAEEVGSMDLRAVELIVLSACQSGLGHVSAGQGVIGLFGAIDRAGAGASVGALWEVDDEASSTLMRDFYQRLWSVDAPPLGPAAALRSTQLAMIRREVKARDGSTFEDPRFWAAFVVGGNPFPVGRGPK